MQAEVARYKTQMINLDQDINDITLRINDRQQALLQENGNSAQVGSRRMPDESQRDFLIRTGKITPFSKTPALSRIREGSTLKDVLLDAENDQEGDEFQVDDPTVTGPVSHRNLLRPGFLDDTTSGVTPDTSEAQRPFKRQKCLSPKLAACDEDVSSKTSGEELKGVGSSPYSTEVAAESGDYDSSSSDHSKANSLGEKRKRRDSIHQGTTGKSQEEDLMGLDDGNEEIFQQRLRIWISKRRAARLRAQEKEDLGVPAAGPTEMHTASERDSTSPAISVDADLTKKEWHMPHPNVPDTVIEEGYSIPGDIYPALFDYQKTGVTWLWQIYSRQVGGIIGDEMGLGKTIQAIAFLAGLHYSKKITKPIIVVAPPTVMKQWVNEFHTWWPPFRVSILHPSGSGMLDIGRETSRENQLLTEGPMASRPKALSKRQKAAQKIVDRVVQDGHILITTYSGLQTYAELLVPVDWEYAILDEGHKIRNPNTAITIYSKEIRTCNRIILSGTPMQNNLIELWSLFDFVYPMRLGTLVDFRSQFEIPIRQGGYANASNLQVQIASQCAETLKSAISPYLLQRFKVDVAADLPKKTERVLFCNLTRQQRRAYEDFLGSDDMRSILSGTRQSLYGIDILRKICNHPDLPDHRILSKSEGYKYGSGNKSGKMVIVKNLLTLWKDAGHKTLLFAQHRIMLDILERYVNGMEGMKYLRMDGNTPISARQALVDKFNTDPTVHVFLLTTKVGGLGVNLTGANRVIIYDPDWNPSTDIQARERAWRLGQKREVQIFRIMTAGTIEEKIFHRQIFKQFLTNKILKDPKQRQTFHLKDLHDLFTLGEANDGATETGRLFEGTEVRFHDEESGTSAAEKIGEAPSGDPGLRSPSDDREIRGLTGVASLEEYKDVDEKPANSEARMLEGIFTKSGVHSALEHDQIINGKKVIRADPRIIEREAQRVAAEAARELQKAEKLARAVEPGTVTWTGEFGTADRPDPLAAQRRLGGGAGRGGPSSSNILAGLQDRQAANNSHTGLPAAGPASKTNVPSRRLGVDFMRKIRDFLAVHGGKAPSQMLVDHFNRFCTNAERVAEFTQMVREIATMQRGQNGRGIWILKEEYKKQGRRS